MQNQNVPKTPERERMPNPYASCLAPARPSFQEPPSYHNFAINHNLRINTQLNFDVNEHDGFSTPKKQKTNQYADCLAPSKK